MKEELLIKGAKDNFHIQTGKWVKILPCTLLESRANFTYKATEHEVVMMVFAATGWTWEETYGSAPIQAANGKMTRAPRNHNRVFRRNLIDFVAMNNGCSLLKLAKYTGRDHSTIIRAVEVFQYDLETRPFARRMFDEVMEFCIENYQEYKGREPINQPVIKEGVKALVG